MAMIVRENVAGYIKHEINKAIQAWLFQGMLGSQFTWDFHGIVSANLLSISPVTWTDFSNAYKIIGTDIVGVKGETALY